MLNVVQDSDSKFMRDSGMRLSGSSGAVHFVTADATLLGKGHLHGTNKAGIDEALRDWNKLPENRRKPGAIKIGEFGPIDYKNSTAPPPQGGLILKLYGRYLAPDALSGLRTTTTAKDFPGIIQPATARPDNWEFYTEANPDFMWLTETEWKSLVPARAKAGDQLAVPGAIIDRMCWYHLLPNAMNSRIGDTWSVIGPKATHGIRAKKMTLTVEAVTPSNMRITLDGFVHLGNAFDPNAPAPKTNAEYHKTLGYEARLRGHLVYDVKRQAFSRFDMIALGDMYGESLEGNWLYRPGRNPVGYAFELVSGQAPADRLPPRGYLNRTALRAYLGLPRPNDAP